VVAYHAGLRGFSGGFVGVDVFFVISGFLISTILFTQQNENRFSILDFYRRRIRRIFPALIVVLAATWIYGWYALLPEELKQLGRQIAAGAGFSSNILVVNGAGYFDQNAASKPLLHLWSLGIEEQYYIFWPWIVAVLWRARNGVRIAAIVGLMVASFALNLMSIGTLPVAAFYLPHTRVWELLIGSALAYYQLFASRNRSTHANGFLSAAKATSFANQACAIVGLTFILLAINRFDSSTVFPGVAALLPTAGTALLIYAGPQAWVNRQILSNRVLVGVGLISYPLYLWHWPLLSGLSISTNNTHFLKVCALGLAFLLAWLTYRFVERPIRHNLLTGVFQRRAGALLVAALTSVAGMGIFTAVQAGFPARFPTEIRQLLNYREEEHLAGWRSDTCFLNSEQDGDSFSGCVDVAPKGAPLVVLWGDSHAADLYPGIHYLQANSNFRLAQFSATACPPIVDFESPKRKACRNINDHVLRSIQELKPDTVIMVAQYWFLSSNVARRNIAETISLVKRAGVRRVLLVGPNPEWLPSEPRLVLTRTQRKVLNKIPDRLTDPLTEKALNGDRDLRVLAEASGAIYLSPLENLCDQSGCLTRVAVAGRVDLLSFDTNHLTTIGSESLASSLLNSYFEDYRRAAHGAASRQ
jgi:peptidoglycan/LPS O-acetylase OafA/YrhL